MWPIESASGADQQVVVPVVVEVDAERERQRSELIALALAPHREHVLEPVAVEVHGAVNQHDLSAEVELGQGESRAGGRLFETGAGAHRHQLQLDVRVIGHVPDDVHHAARLLVEDARPVGQAGPRLADGQVGPAVAVEVAGRDLDGPFDPHVGRQDAVRDAPDHDIGAPGAVRRR